jgi:hypothetical protein
MARLKRALPFPAKVRFIVSGEPGENSNQRAAEAVF